MAYSSIVFLVFASCGGFVTVKPKPTRTCPNLASDVVVRSGWRTPSGVATSYDVPTLMVANRWSVGFRARARAVNGLFRHRFLGFRVVWR